MLLLSKRFLDFLFPRTCVVCDCRLALDEDFLCPRCRMELPFEQIDTDWQHNRHLLRWIAEHPTLQRMGALCIYQRENAAARLVHEVKFGRDYDLGVWMGRLAARRLRDSGLFDDVDALVPLPLSEHRLHQRGFNQAEAIAKGLSEVLALDVRTDLIRRPCDRESQTHFHLHERFLNANNIFARAADVEVADCHLMLVDDVMTTGATMMSAVETLEGLPGVRLSTFCWSWVRLSDREWTQARQGSEA